jgi:hypothetical protein
MLIWIEVSVRQNTEGNLYRQRKAEHAFYVMTFKCSTQEFRGYIAEPVLKHRTQGSKLHI